MEDPDPIYASTIEAKRLWLKGEIQYKALNIHRTKVALLCDNSHTTLEYFVSKSVNWAAGNAYNPHTIAYQALDTYMHAVNNGIYNGSQSNPIRDELGELLIALIETNRKDNK